MTNTPLLQLDHIDTFYGAVQVHFGLSLHVNTGEIVCLLGGNASGKSTTMKVILGLVKPRSGRVLLDGQEITGLPTPQIIRRGIGSVPEARRIFPHMTVRENLLMGAFIRDDRAAIQADYERVLDLFPQLRARINQPGGVLSGGEQQMLAIGARADGPPAPDLHGRADDGLIANAFVDTRFGTLIQTDQRSRARRFLWSSKTPTLHCKSRNRGYVLQNGRVVLEGGAAHNLLDSREIQAAYLGSV